jgi:hypothetical protein
MLVHTRARGSTIFHPSGTCMMGPVANPMAVVDHEAARERPRSPSDSLKVGKGACGREARKEMR